MKCIRTQGSWISWLIPFGVLSHVSYTPFAGTMAYSFKWLYKKMTFNNKRWMHITLVDSFCFMLSWLVLNLRYMFNCPFSIMVTFLKCQQWFQPQPFVYFWMLQHQERHANNALHYTNNLSPQKNAPSFKLFRTKRTKTIKHCFW